MTIFSDAVIKNLIPVLKDIISTSKYNDESTTNKFLYYFNSSRDPKISAAKRAAVKSLIKAIEELITNQQDDEALYKAIMERIKQTNTKCSDISQTLPTNGYTGPALSKARIFLEHIYGKITFLALVNAKPYADPSITAQYFHALYVIQVLNREHYPSLCSFMNNRCRPRKVADRGL